MRYLLLLIIFAVALPSWAGTPTLVQQVWGPSESSVITSYKLQLPNNSLSNNTILVGITTNTPGVTITVADNKSNSYSSLASITSGNQVVNIFCASSTTAGVNTITISLSGGGIGDVQSEATEFQNAGCTTDGTATGSGTAAAIATAQITTTTPGDLIYQYGISDSGSSPISSITQGTSPWKLLSADVHTDRWLDGGAAQYQVQSSAGNITPSFTQDLSTNHFDTVAVAVKATSTGTAPAAGIRIVSAMKQLIDGSLGTPFVTQFPSTGNMIVATWISVQALSPTTVTDGNSNSYSAAGAVLGNAGGSLRIYYSCGATTSTTMTGPTFNFTGTNSNGDTIVLYDVTGAATSNCFDSTAGNPTATGTDSTAAAHNITGPTITPTTSNGLIFAIMGVANPGPVNAASTSADTTPLFISDQQVPNVGNSEMVENNGWSIEYNASTASRSFSFHFPATAGGAGVWDSMVAAFKAPPSAVASMPASIY